MKTNMIPAIITPLLATAIIFSCGQPSPPPDPHIALFTAQIDSLKTEIENSKPAVNDMMETIRQHHAKLWFAGKNSNWPLAKFEVDKIKAAVAKIKLLYAGTPDAIALPMIDPALDNITATVGAKDEKKFETDYATLTQTCNNCHVAVKFNMNVITLPSSPPVPDQDFSVPKE